MIGAQVAVFDADRPPTTLLDSCGSSAGVACRLVWDFSHDGRAAQLTSDFLAGPVHLLLRVVYVIVLALVIRAVVFRVINRITERAALSFLPQQLRSGVGGVAGAAGHATARLLPRVIPQRLRGGRSDGRTRATPDEEAIADAIAIAEAESSTPAVGSPPDASASGGENASASETAGAPAVSAAAVQAEAALIDERRQQRVRALGSILRSTASATILSIAGVVVLGDLGINLAPLLASAGVVGIAVGFGAQNLVRDYLSGIFMLLEDQYGVGDVITVGDATGTVETVSLRITRMRDVNGIVWHIRNGAIEQVGNESQGWARAVIDFPVPYSADLATIRGLLSEVALGLWNEPEWRAVLLEQPEVWGAQEVSSDEVTMRMVAKTAPLRQWEVEREMRARVKAALDAADIRPAEGETATAPAASAPEHRQKSGGR